MTSNEWGDMRVFHLHELVGGGVLRCGGAMVVMHHRQRWNPSGRRRVHRSVAGRPQGAQPRRLVHARRWRVFRDRLRFGGPAPNSGGLIPFRRSANAIHAANRAAFCNRASAGAGPHTRCAARPPAACDMASN